MQYDFEIGNATATVRDLKKIASSTHEIIAQNGNFGEGSGVTIRNDAVAALDYFDQTKDLSSIKEYIVNIINCAAIDLPDLYPGSTIGDGNCSG